MFSYVVMCNSNPILLHINGGWVAVFCNFDYVNFCLTIRHKTNKKSCKSICLFICCHWTFMSSILFLYNLFMDTIATAKMTWKCSRVYEDWLRLSSRFRIYFSYFLNHSGGLFVAMKLSFIIFSLKMFVIPLGLYFWKLFPFTQFRVHTVF